MEEIKKRTLNVEWTGRVDVVRENGEVVSRLAVWEGINQDGKKVRVYIEKVEEIEKDERG